MTAILSQPQCVNVQAESPGKAPFQCLGGQCFACDRENMVGGDWHCLIHM